MADRASASILIGGVLPRDLVDPLLDAIGADGGHDGWDEVPIDVGALDRRDPLEVCGYDLAGGVFDRLEDFCAEHGLSYVRSSGSCPGAFGPERVVFEGVGEPRHYALDEDDRVVIDRATLDRLGSVEAARAFFAAAEFAPPPLVLGGPRPDGRRGGEAGSGDRAGTVPNA
jgi:hypothetical protein